VLRLVIVVLILAPILRLAPQILGVRRARTRTVSWPRLLAVKVPLVALAVLADWGLRHWMTATASGLVTAVALAASVATLGPVLHSHLFVPVRGAGPAGRAARPAHRSRRPAVLRTGVVVLVLAAGFLLKIFAVHWILRHGLTDSGLAVEAALGAVVAALAVTAWTRNRRPAAPVDKHPDQKPSTEEAEHATAQHLADHVRPAPSRRDGVRRRPGGADPPH
jgi:hypothetical protein